MASRQKLSPCPRCCARVELTVDTEANANTLRGRRSFQVRCDCGLHERGLAFSSGRREAAIDEWNVFAAGERWRLEAVRPLSSLLPTVVATTGAKAPGLTDPLQEQSALHALALLERAGLLRIRPDLDCEQVRAVSAAASVLLRHSFTANQLLTGSASERRLSRSRPALAPSQEET